MSNHFPWGARLIALFIIAMLLFPGNVCAYFQAGSTGPTGGNFGPNSGDEVSVAGMKGTTIQNTRQLQSVIQLKHLQEPQEWTSATFFTKKWQLVHYASVDSRPSIDIDPNPDDVHIFQPVDTHPTQMQINGEAQAKLLAKAPNGKVLRPYRQITQKCEQAINAAAANNVVGAVSDSIANKDEYLTRMSMDCSVKLFLGADGQARTADLNSRVPKWVRDQHVENLITFIYVKRRSSPGAIVAGVNSDYYLRCTGLLVGRRSLVTARHCVEDSANGDPTDIGYSFKVNSQKETVAKAAPYNSAIIEVVGITPSNGLKGEAYGDPDDFIMLTLAADAINYDPKISFRPADSGEELFIVGPSYSQGTHQHGQMAEAEFPGEADCQAVYYDEGGLLVHDCQTRNGYSGAPMFASRNEAEEEAGQIRVVGFELQAKGSLETFYRNEALSSSSAEELLSTWGYSDVVSPQPGRLP